MWAIAAIGACVIFIAVCVLGFVVIFRDGIDL